MTNSQQLLDAATWADMDKLNAIFADLRQNDPVHYQEPGIYPGLWHITKNADIMEVEKEQDAFLHAPRMRIMTLEEEQHMAQLASASVEFSSVVTMDQPDHLPMRRLTQAWFQPKNIARVAPTIAESATIALDQLTANATCEFAEDVAIEYPLRVIMSILGMPAEDFPKILRLTQETFGANDPDFQRHQKDGPQRILDTLNEFMDYFNALAASRQANPTDDLASLIANGEVGEEPIDIKDIRGYYYAISTAGHDTTSYSLIEAVYRLAKDPTLYERLKQDPENLAPKITEEAIRIASPVRHFIRTAARDYELRGKTIKAGDAVVTWYVSGSRDEELFDNPHSFDPDRKGTARHSGFGFAAHMCLGMHLARREITTFLQMMVEQVDSLELLEEPSYMLSNWVSGIKKLPIKVHLKQEQPATEPA